MDHYDRALKRLRDDERPLNELERQSGIPAETLRDMKNNPDISPRLNTLKKLVGLYYPSRRAA
jgi:hypothetical protein